MVIPPHMPPAHHPAPSPPPNHDGHDERRNRHNDGGGGYETWDFYPDYYPPAVYLSDDDVYINPNTQPSYAQPSTNTSMFSPNWSILFWLLLFIIVCYLVFMPRSL